MNIDAFGASLIEAALFTPISLEYPDAWCGHIPFASWLIEQLKPDSLVELGTHTGNSYFAFCQAVKEYGLETRCYAVDSWEGDEHAGHYANEIYETVNAHNELHYASFSRLMRMLFDEGVTHFPDYSIQLLHVDGLHTYEAVKHDFETWLPKLAPGAVVLFHDTNVRERDFGVWRLWNELRQRYNRTMEFDHSNGLGVLQLEGGTPDKSLHWLQEDDSCRPLLRKYFAAVGEYQVSRLNRKLRERYVAELNDTVKALRDTVVEQDHTVQAKQKQIQAMQEQIYTITHSKSWLLTLPLRKISRWVSGAKQ